MSLHSFSNEGQDILTLKLIGPSGFFLDIGSGNPVYGNNSFVLELMGWRGLMVDGSEESIQRARRYRSNPAVLTDATRADWVALLQAVNAPPVIDYISLDVDEANINVVSSFPFDRYQFRLMTYEHDRYNSGDARKVACEEALRPYPQYVRLLDNATVQGLEWEDWWVNRDLIDPKFFSYAVKGVDWREFISRLP